MSTSVIIVRQSRRLDGTAVANATGVVGSHTQAPRLTDDGMTQLAWAIDGIGSEEFTALLAEIRGIFGSDAVTAVIISPAPATAPVQQPADDGLRVGRQVDGIAQ